MKVANDLCARYTDQDGTMTSESILNIISDAITDCQDLLQSLIAKQLRGRPAALKQQNVDLQTRANLLRQHITVFRNDLFKSVVEERRYDSAEESLTYLILPDILAKLGQSIIWQTQQGNAITTRSSSLGLFPYGYNENL